MHLRLPTAFRASSHIRGFASTAPRAAKPTQITIESKTYDILEPPPYPYGAARWFKQSNRGLYGGLSVRYGNNVSERTETKTRRTWHPNIVRKNIFCAALNRRIRLRVSTRVLRTIDKVGGLDEYLLGEKEARIKELGVEGWKLRWAVMMSDWGRAKLGRQAKALGVSDEIRQQRGWMKKSEFERYMLRLRQDKKRTAEEVELEERFNAGQMDESEKKDYLKAKAQEDSQRKAAIWADPAVQEAWKQSRGTRVLVAKSKTKKGKEVQRVLVLKEAADTQEKALEAVEEWTEEDDARDESDVEPLATLAEDALSTVEQTPKEGARVVS